MERDGSGTPLRSPGAAGFCGKLAFILELSKYYRGNGMGTLRAPFRSFLILDEELHPQFDDQLFNVPFPLF